jgi:hypothetical protein
MRYLEHSCVCGTANGTFRYIDQKYI